MSTRLSLCRDLSLFRQSLNERKPKGSFPSFDDGQSRIIMPRMDPSITSAKPRKRKRRENRKSNNDHDNQSSSNTISSTKSALAVLRRLWSTSYVTLLPQLVMESHRGGDGPARKKRRYDWNVFKSLRSESNSDEDELPLMKDFDETTLEEMSSWDLNEMVSDSQGEIWTNEDKETSPSFSFYVLVHANNELANDKEEHL